MFLIRRNEQHSSGLNVDCLTTTGELCPPGGDDVYLIFRVRTLFIDGTGAE